MSDRIYSVMTNRDSLFCKIKDDDSVVNTSISEDGELFVTGFNSQYIVLENIYIFSQTNDGQLNLISFKDTGIGSKRVCVNTSQVVEVYLLQEELSNKIRATISGISLIK